MKSLESRYYKIKEQFEVAIAQASSSGEVEELRVVYLGRSGHITELLSHLKDLSIEDKKNMGPLLNSLRMAATEQLSLVKEKFVAQEIAFELAKKANFDVTAYQPDQLCGTLHPYTHIIRRIEDIFMSMGFSYATGPEIETEWFNFDALNIPAQHPARDMQDTFWLDVPGMLLRTHTSNVQIRTMKQQKPPLAIFCTGRVYRHEATDATHDFMFTQVEGMLIDTNVSLDQLIAVLKQFMQALFDKKELNIRLRPSYFPFVEPGLEVDISCIFCSDGCGICKKSGWIELGGAGLIHAHVLNGCGIDSEKYSGFAFGMGIERLAMLLYGINDIRLFHSGKIEFLKQF